MNGRRRGLLLDRDGVINVDCGYVGDPKDFALTSGLPTFLKASVDRGYRLAIVTNQSGVARGFYTVDDYQNVTRRMLDLLAGEGVTIDLVLACFEMEGGVVQAFNRQSYWRKPNPGMILEAALRLDLDLPRSVMVGDHERDMQAASAAGVGKRLWLTSSESAPATGVVKVSNFEEAFSALP